MKKPLIAILGGGPAGVGAAWRLRLEDKADVLVLEKGEKLGGNAGSFEFGGRRVDFGSHRLHPATDPSILHDIKELLGPELLDRPRHGRIRLLDKWIHFPLKPQDLALRLPPAFGFGVARDALSKFMPGNGDGGDETFTSVLEKGLGKTICREFYFPYARKIWGLDPEELSAIQARRRVSAGSIGKIIKKVMSALPGLGAPGAGRFYYPRSGFGQITEAIAERATQLGAEVRMNSTVREIRLGERPEILIESAGAVEKISVDHVWSTIPVTKLIEALQPAPPPEVVDAGRRLTYRAMILIYLLVDRPQWTEFDAHYFPEEKIRLTRLSEPKNYSLVDEPQDTTVLCGELPCFVDDEIWNASDEALGKLVEESLEKCGVPVGAKILKVATRRLPFAYPIYVKGFEEPFKAQDEWLETVDNLISFGRQGLFAHDNTHHALAMAYGAVDCLGENGFNRSKWTEYREEFAKHVVED